MSFARFDPTVKSYWTARSTTGAICTHCGGRLTDDDDGLCAECEDKDRIPQDPNLECLFKLIERRCDQLYTAMRDHTASEEERARAKSALSTARAILEDVVRIDREDR